VIRVWTQLSIRLGRLSGGRPLVDTHGTAAFLDPSQNVAVMSDMLQLVVRIPRDSSWHKCDRRVSDMLPQSGGYYQRRILSVAKAHDKLKHVGHLPTLYVESCQSQDKLKHVGHFETP
jgi:hypothetical protein